MTKAKFVLVGIWTTIFGYLAFIGLDFWLSRVFDTRYMAYMTSIVIANIVSIANAYVFHKYFTFRSRERGKALAIEFIRFCATYAVTFILNLFLLPIFVEIGRITPRAAAALAIPICTVISYLGHSRFSFGIGGTHGVVKGKVDSRD